MQRQQTIYETPHHANAIRRKAPPVRAQVIYALEDKKPEHPVSVFLAGSRDQAPEWQQEAIRRLQDLPITIYNPRVQTRNFSEHQVKRQLEWELKRLREVSVIMMFFAPELPSQMPQSPMALIELGVHVEDPRLIVGCPFGFSAYGSVEATTAFYGARMVENFNDLVDETRKKLSSSHRR